MSLKEKEPTKATAEVIPHPGTADVVRDWRHLSYCVGQVNIYATDEEDEFTITREDGRRQGIFKTWAVPVIPFLTGGRLELIAEEMLYPAVRAETNLKRRHHRPTGLENARLGAMLEKWESKMTECPLVLYQELKRSLAHSLIADQRLMQIFAQEETPSDPTARLEVLVNRLRLSLGLLSPFYHLEAIVGGAGEAWRQLATTPEMTARHPRPRSGGSLDLAAQLLPSAFKSACLAEAGDWHGLTWETLNQMAAGLLSHDSPQRLILLRLSRRLGAPVPDILFAINALEWIPRRVGGKKDDLDQKTAQTILLNLEETPLGQLPPSERPLAAAASINAEIRFRNWLPAVRGEENFAGANWTYGSICDTTAQLRELLLNHPGLWKEDFASVFIQQLAPQLEELDAKSAQGRFLLHLIDVEKRIRPESRPRPDRKWLEKTLLRMKRMRETAWVRSLGDGLVPRSLLGGKAFGLEFIQQSLVEAGVPPGLVVTTEAMEDVLRQDAELWRLILDLEDVENDVLRLDLGRQIQLKIADLDLPQNLEAVIKRRIQEAGWEDRQLIIRSSSGDEDNTALTGNTGAGNYHSPVIGNTSRLIPAIRDCLASFFSPRAMRYREMIGLSDKPEFAVLIQPLIEGKIGVAFSHNPSGSSRGPVLAWSESNAAVAGGSDRFIEVEVGKTGEIALANLGGEEASLAENVLKRLEQITFLTRQPIDLEWAADGTNVWILQARSLPRPPQNPRPSSIRESRIVQSIEAGLDLDKTVRQLEGTEGTVELIVGKEINLDLFQGDLFFILSRFSGRLAQIRLKRRISQVSHFANICACLGIRVIIDQEKNQ